MKKGLLFLLLPVFFISCSRFFENLGRSLHNDKSCWIDTRTMVFHYDSREVMSGIYIWLYTDKKEIEFKDTTGQTAISNIDLSGLKEVLTRQDINIQVRRDNVHWRDGMDFYIRPSDWKKKRMIYSTHIYH